MDHNSNGNTEPLRTDWQQNTMGSPNPSGQTTVSEQRPVQAVLSLIFGIVSILLSFCGCGGIIGLILGITALILGASARKKMQPDGVLKAGTVTAIIGIVLSVIGLILFFAMGMFASIMEELQNNPEPDPYAISDWVEPESTEPINISWDDSTDEPEPVSTEPVVDIPEGMKWVGNDDVGYTLIPAEFVSFAEIGGTGWTYSDQYSDATGVEIVGMFAETGYSASEIAGNMEAALQNGAIEGVDTNTIASYQESVAGYDGYTISSYFPDDNMYLYQRVFDAEDGRVHYLSAEYAADGDYTDLWVNTFSYWQLAAPATE